MTKDTLASLIVLFDPLLRALAALLAAYLTRLIAAHVRDLRAANALTLATNEMESVVSDLYQSTVADLKNPDKPGDWTSLAAHAMKARALVMFHERYPALIKSLTALARDPEHLNEILSGKLEKAVVSVNAKTRPNPSPVVIEAAPLIQSPADAKMTEGETLFPPASEPVSDR